jgi:hypothetical protein
MNRRAYITVIALTATALGCGINAEHEQASMKVLMEAAENCDLNRFTAEMAKGFDPGRLNRFDGQGVITPLHSAAGKGCTGIVRLLLDHGVKADLRVADDGSKLAGATPLVFAVLMKHTDAANLLIDRGASLNVTYGPVVGPYGRVSLWDLAVEKDKSLDIVASIMRHDPKRTGQELSDAVARGLLEDNLPLIETIIRGGYKPTRLDVMMAVKHKRKDVASVLLDAMLVGTSPAFGQLQRNSLCPDCPRSHK